MGLIAKETGGTSFAPVAAGVHQAVCYLVCDLGTHDDEYQGRHKDRHEVVIGWEIPGERITVERDGQNVDLPRAISNRYTLSLGGKANLRRDLEAWRGKEFTAEELAGFDLATVVGANCLLQVVHKAKQDGSTRAAISSIMALPKGTKRVKGEHEPQYWSIEDGTDIPDNLPEWIVGVIQESYEWKARQGEVRSDADEGEPPEDMASDGDDDLPF